MVPRAVPRPLVEFLRTEAASGIVLVIAAVVAMVWANSPWSASYGEVWDAELGGLTAQMWVGEALMAIFFLVVGLEIKRELVVGELRGRQRAALPVIAAAGGMVVPALVYLAINATSSSRAGWGIPVATDIAMAVGVFTLVGSRVPPSLKLFLLALAIVDDIGAILVIAVVYSDDLDGRALLVAAGLVVALSVVARRSSRGSGVVVGVVVAALGVALWVALHESGVHPTLAGVVVALCTPLRMIEPLEHRLHPWASFGIVPLFALSHAGVAVSADALGDAATSTVTAGVVLGLVVGKPVGILAATWIAVRLRLCALPAGATWGGVGGVGALAGIGFTVSIFVTGLAFAGQPDRQQEAKLGILVASAIAAALGGLLLRSRLSGARPRPARAP